MLILRPPHPWCANTFTGSRIRKYRKSYCTHPGVGVGVRIGVAQMLVFFFFFFFFFFINLYLLNILMDQVDTLHLVDIGLKFLSCTTMTHLSDLEVKVRDLEVECLSSWFKFI